MDELDFKFSLFPDNKLGRHVWRYRGRYAAATTLVATCAFFNKLDRVSDWREFLEEKGLTDEFFLPED